MKAEYIKNVVTGLIIALVFLVLFELILMVAGVTPLYERTDTSVGFSGYAPLFQKHTQPDGVKVYQTAQNKTQWFNMQRFPASKADGVTRIFCLGGSTTYGRPYDDRTSFCGWLRLFLPAVDSSRRWEVINAGGISYASYRVARVMEELANYEPDLFIIYTGHNEFLESRTYSKLLQVPGFVRGLAVQASRSRIYTLLYDIINKPSELLPTEVEAMLDRSIGPEDYHRDDQMRQAVLEDYARSLLSMTQISDRAGAKLIFVTPASNIGDFSPFKSEPSSHLGPLDISRVDTLKRMAAMAISEGKYASAEFMVTEALRIDSRDPDLLYLRGQALRNLGRIDEAHSAFIKSKDEDICPLRALKPVRAMVSDIARSNHAGFVDFVQIVSEQSPDGIAGSELFLDHVHPTIEGNRLLALAIMEEMSQEGFVPDASTWKKDELAAISKVHVNSLDEKTHAVALRNLSKVLGWAGKDEEAARLANMAVQIIPEDSEAQTQEGLLLWRAGNREEALVHLREAESLDPYNASIHRSLGVLLSELNRMDEALEQFNEAISLDPELTEVHYDLGVVLQSQGKTKQAETAFRKAIKQNPDHADACNNLGIILAQRGNFEAAYEQFARALELDPENQNAAANLTKARMALEQLSQEK